MARQTRHAEAEAENQDALEADQERHDNTPQSADGTELTAFEMEQNARFEAANEAKEDRDALATEVAEALADPDFEDPTGAAVPGSSMSLSQAAAATGHEEALGPLGSATATYVPGAIPPVGTYSTPFYPPVDYGDVDPVQGDNITGWTPLTGSTPNRTATLVSGGSMANRITEQDLVNVTTGDAAFGGVMAAMGLRIGDPLPPENTVEDLVETDGKANLSFATYGTFEFKDYCRRPRATTLPIIASFRNKYASGVEAPVPQT